MDARVDLVSSQNQSLANRAYLDAMNAALADTQNRIAKVNLSWLPAEKQAGLANVIAQSAPVLIVSFSVFSVSALIFEACALLSAI